MCITAISPSVAQLDWGPLLRFWAIKYNDGDFSTNAGMRDSLATGMATTRQGVCAVQTHGTRANHLQAEEGTMPDVTAFLRVPGNVKQELCV